MSAEAIKVYFGIAGTALGLVGSTVLVHQIGFRAMAIAIGALSLVCQYVAIGGVWERASVGGYRPRSGSARRSGRRTAARAFRVLLPTVVLFALAFQLLQTDIPFYVHAVLGMSTWAGSTVLLAAAIAAALAALPLFARLGAAHLEAPRQPGCRCSRRRSPSRAEDGQNEADEADELAGKSPGRQPALAWIGVLEQRELRVVHSAAPPARVATASTPRRESRGRRGRARSSRPGRRGRRALPAATAASAARAARRGDRPSGLARRERDAGEQLPNCGPVVAERALCCLTRGERSGTRPGADRLPPARAKRSASGRRPAR